jgi:hypothetical protein
MYNMMSKYEKMPLFKIKDFIPLMRVENVSRVSREKGFLRRLQVVQGRYDRMGYINFKKNKETWLQRRENFIKRHLAQVIKRDEPLYQVNGLPTRRTLSFYAWGYDPSPNDTRKARIIIKQNRR